MKTMFSIVGLMVCLNVQLIAQIPETPDTTKAFLATKYGPLAPKILTPSNGATGVSTLPTLTWTCTGLNAQSFDVYMGTSNPPTLVKTVVGCSYTPPTTVPLPGGTKIYAQVVAKNTKPATANSALISFTTAAGPVPLSMVCPASQAITSATAVAVTLTAPTINGGMLPVTVVAVPASGSVFSIGSTPVTWTATDAAATKVTCSTSVVITAPTTVSPNCTKVLPGGGTIVLADASVWSLDLATNNTLRNGVQVGGGAGTVMEVSAGQIQVSGFPDSATWYLWNGGNWQNTGLGDPCGVTPPPVGKVSWLEFNQEDPIFGVTSYNIYIDALKASVSLSCVAPTNTCTGFLPTLASGTHTVAVSAVSSLGESSITNCTSCSAQVTVP